MQDEPKQLLASLSEAFGPPGFEDDVRKVIADKLGSFCRVDYDLVGSIVCRKDGASPSPKIMLAAHMDEVGFMVQAVRDDGCATFVGLGSWRVEELPGMVVLLKTETQLIPGVIGSVPVHFTRGRRPEELPRPSFERLFVDFGAADKQHAERLGVRPGVPFVPATRFSVLADADLYLGKAWDDRAGCGVMVEVVRRLRADSHPNAVYAVGTVQEEVGSKGALTAARLVSPDIALILEGGPADDTVERHGPPQGKLGHGPQIRYYDPSMLPNRALTNLVVKTAESLGIPYQLLVRRSGGTDGRKIQITGPGVPCAVISLPCRYVHSPAGVLSRKDFDLAVELVRSFILQYDEALHQKTISWVQH